MKRTRPLDRILAAVPLLALLAACAAPPGQQPPPPPPPSGGGPSFAINSPADGASVAGISWFSVQPYRTSDVARVTFRAGDDEIGSDSDASDGFRVFLDSDDFAAGPLELTALVTGTDGKSSSETITVDNVPAPPASATVGPDGAVLGTAAGSVLSLAPGVAAGATVTLTERSQAQIESETGIDYEGLGITFLGAQRLDSDRAIEGPLGTLSAGFGNAVQPGQAVVQFGIVPDMDGDGIDELIVTNGATVTPDGGVLSDPLPVAMLGERAAANGALRRMQAGPLAIRQGDVLSVEITGFNRFQLIGNEAEFASSAAAGTTAMPGAVSFDPENLPNGQLFHTIVPLELPLGPASVALRQLAVYRSGMVRTLREVTIDIEVLERPAAAGPPGELTVEFLQELAAELEKLPADTPEQIEQVQQIVAAVEEAAAGAEAVAADATPAEQEALERSDRAFTDIPVPVIDPARNCLSQRDYDDLKALYWNMVEQERIYRVQGATALANDFRQAADELFNFIIFHFDNEEFNCDLQTEPRPDPAPVPAVPPLPDGSPAPSVPASSAVAGAGSAVPPGGSGHGAPLPPSESPSELRAQQFELVPLEHRFLVRIDVNGSPAPFSGVSDASGYIFVPFIPAGQPFVATATDSVTGETRTVEGIGPQGVRSVFLPFNFAAGDPTGAPCELPTGFTKVWTGALDDRWTTPENWSPQGVPTGDDDVFVCADAVGQPRMNEFGTARTLQVEGGALLNLQSSNLMVFGDVIADGEITGSFALRMRGENTTLRGTVGAVWIEETVALSGDTTITGEIDIAEHGGTDQDAGLMVNGHTLTVLGNMTFSNISAFEMTDPASLVTVEGRARFHNNFVPALLTAGEMRLRGTVEFCTDTNGFATTGSFHVVLDGSAPQSIARSCAAVVSAAFRTLELTNSTGVSLEAMTISIGEELLVGENVTVSGSLSGNTSIAAGATLRTLPGSDFAPGGTVFLSGDLDVGGDFRPQKIRFSNSDIPGGLDYQEVEVFGTSTLLGSATFAGGLAFRQFDADQLVLNGNTLTIEGDVRYNEFTLADPADLLIIEGEARMTAGNGSSTLSAGELRLRGDVITCSNGFNSTGTRVVFDGSAAQQLTRFVGVGVPICDPSTLQDVAITNPAGLTVVGSTGTDLVIDGDLDLSGRLITETATHIGGIDTLHLRSSAVLDNSGTMNVAGCTKEAGHVITGTDPCP